MIPRGLRIKHVAQYNQDTADKSLILVALGVSREMEISIGFALSAVSLTALMRRFLRRDLCDRD
jgi:hypothetical protein